MITDVLCLPTWTDQRGWYLMTSCATAGASDAQVGLGPVVEDEHQRAANAAHNVCEESLVEAGGQTLFGGDLLEAVHGALVEVLLHGLLGLHLQAAAHGVEGVGGARADGDGGLGRGKGAHGPHDALVLLPGVQAGDGVEGAKLEATVPDMPTTETPN